MDLSDLVCTFEQAKRLKELGVDCIGHFHYHEWGADKIIMSAPRSHAHQFYAYTSAELGGLLDNQVWDWRQYNQGALISFHFMGNVGLNGNIKDDCFYTFEPSIKTETEAQARAEFLIYLLENKK